MAATILLAGLRRRGFRLGLSPAADGLVKRGWRLWAEPWSKLSETDRAALSKHRDGLIDVLHAEQESRTEPAVQRSLGWDSCHQAPPDEEWDDEAGEWIVRPKPILLCLLPPGPPPPPLPPLPEAGPITPPPGARLYFATAKGRPCPACGTGPRKKRIPPAVWCWGGSGLGWFPFDTHPPALPASVLEGEVDEPEEE